MTGYYQPSGADWHVEFGDPDKNGRMMAKIIQRGEVIAILAQPATQEHIVIMANEFMKNLEKEQ